MAATAFSTHRMTRFLIEQTYMALKVHTIADPCSNLASKQSGLESFRRWISDTSSIAFGQHEMRLAAVHFPRERSGEQLFPSVIEESMEWENYCLIKPKTHQCEVILQANSKYMLPHLL